MAKKIDRYLLISLCIFFISMIPTGWFSFVEPTSSSAIQLYFFSESFNTIGIWFTTAIVLVALWIMYSKKANKKLFLGLGYLFLIAASLFNFIKFNNILPLITICISVIGFIFYVFGMIKLKETLTIN